MTRRVFSALILTSMLMLLVGHASAYVTDSGSLFCGGGAYWYVPAGSSRTVSVYPMNYIPQFGSSPSLNTLKDSADRTYEEWEFFGHNRMTLDFQGHLPWADGIVVNDGTWWNDDYNN